MLKGWFVGDFTPTAYSTSNVEVAVKHYKAGEKERLHYHKVSTEITLIVSGEVKMLNCAWKSGDIVVIEPGTATEFEAITDTVNVVVKLPSTANDKYYGTPTL